MRDASSWTLSLGRWFGVPVRLHASCLVFAMTIMYVASRASPEQEMVGYGLLAIVIWLLSLLIHQAGHLIAAARLGGICERVVISPLGDLVPVSIPQDARRELAAAVAGPVFNAIVLIIVTPALLLSGADVRDLLFSPLMPQNLVVGGVGLVALKMMFWCNWLLILANLLPALPMDAGRAVCAGLRPTMGEKDAVVTVARVGGLVCILGLWLWGLLDSKTGLLVPPWFPLSLVSLYLFFMARHELLRMDDDERDGDLLGYDFSQGYTSLERPGDGARREPGPMRRWLKQRREQKQRRIRQIEEEEERRVDEVLARVKDVGLDALSSEERALLQRVSARYRDRLS
jgi:stage IV sporulation protein FB